MLKINYTGCPVSIKFRGIILYLHQQLLYFIVLMRDENVFPHFEKEEKRDNFI